jgi:hypothetical protein
MVRRMDYRPIGMRNARPSWATPVMLVASSGGHPPQLVQIRDQWPRSAHVWVTFNEPDARSLLGAVFALIAVLIKLDSRGTVFFRHVRMGAAIARGGSASSAR